MSERTYVATSPDLLVKMIDDEIYDPDGDYNDEDDHDDDEDDDEDEDDDGDNREKVGEVGLYGVSVMALSDREICEETPTILQTTSQIQIQKSKKVG